MSTLDREALRQRIHEAIAETEQKIAGYTTSSEPVAPDDAIGRVSRMDAINNKSVMEAALRQAQRKLQQLRHALVHLPDPDFGLCRRCGQAIPVQRILLMPQSPFCVRCAR